MGCPTILKLRRDTEEWENAKEERKKAEKMFLPFSSKRRKEWVMKKCFLSCL